MLNFINENDCTGCSACVNICPISCISMQENEEGFLYPSSDNRCIHCNKCKIVCPIYNKKNERKPDIEQHSVAAVTKNINVWKDSTSGGAFTEICNTYGDDDTIIFGATFQKLKVVHSYVIGTKNIYIFRKSKYVQSDLGNCFHKVDEFLKQDKKVIFSGTPCEIAGLRSYLGKDYDNLLCIDLICHGVGSPKVFLKTLEFLSKKYKSKIVKYIFRYKKLKFGNFTEYLSSYVFENKKIFFIENDEYNQLFLSQLCLRKSCQSNCRFRTSNRMGDITIGDFKNKNKLLHYMKDYRNYSTIVINNKKAEKIFNKLGERMDIIPCDIEDIKKYNPLFYRTTIDNPLRDKFFQDFIKNNIINVLTKYNSNRKRRLGFIKYIIPYGIKLRLLRMLKL